MKINIIIFPHQTKTVEVTKRERFDLTHILHR